jgi:hypothetical protein
MEPRGIIGRNLVRSIDILLMSLFYSYVLQVNLFLSSIFTFLNYLKK